MALPRSKWVAGLVFKAVTGSFQLKKTEKNCVINIYFVSCNEHELEIRVQKAGCYTYKYFDNYGDHGCHYMGIRDPFCSFQKVDY